jgi:ABC-2 type transport system permease protein
VGALIKKYARIWRVLVLNSFKTQMATWFASAGYLLGKILRFGFFLAYLLGIFQHIPSLKGYSMPEVVLFFMTFNLVDVGAQFLFRGLYGVKVLIEEGDFDKILTQPAHALFRISVMGMDLLDLLTLIPIGIVTIWALAKLPHPVTAQQIFLYVLLMANALVMAYAFHVIIGALSVRTQEMEGAIWIYRDVMTLGRFPMNIYSEIIRGLFVTVVPVGIMVSFPSEALLGLLSLKSVLYACLLGGFFHLAAQGFWRRALRDYTSIST